MSRTETPTLVAGVGELALAIADALSQTGCRTRAADSLAPAAIADILAEGFPLDGLVIVGPRSMRGSEFLAVDDLQLESSLTAFLDLFEGLGLMMTALPEGAAVLYVGARGHLGAWGCAHEAAFGGAIAGLMRSLALEAMPRGVRVNVVAVDYPDDPTRIAGADMLSQVASLAAFLVSPAAAAVNGELILANRGASLKIREARNRGGRPENHPSTRRAPAARDAGGTIP